MEQVFAMTTPHYKFRLKVSDIDDPVHIRRFDIGDAKGICLEASLIMPDADERFAIDAHICTVSKLDTLDSCLLEPSDSETSLGTELILGFISILKANYPHITQLSLRDSSFIPCDRSLGETLDLLTYSIALYGKTWYEQVLGAHVQNAAEFRRYRDAIAVYMSPAAKRDWVWEQFWAMIAGKNRFANEKIRENVDGFKRIFDEATTWPECIKRMKNAVEKSDKCKFFKTWLEQFIYSHVPEKRDWVVDIERNTILTNVLNTRSQRPMRARTSTRKRKRMM